MIIWEMKKRVIAIFAVLVLSVGGAVVVLYQPSEKTDEIYSSALEDFSKGNYQNAYYLFSKV